MQTAIPCWVMRGGTSKGLYFLARDLPSDEETRSAVLLAAMGSRDSEMNICVAGAGAFGIKYIEALKKSPMCKSQISPAVLRPTRKRLRTNMESRNGLRGWMTV